MRNRTAIRLLYLLAVLAGVLPPLLFLGYAYRQGVAEANRDMAFVGAGTLLRTEAVLDTVGTTLRKVAGITQGRIDAGTLRTLRQAVFLDRYVQAIGIRQGSTLLCTSEQIYERPEPILDPNLPPLPRPGAVDVQPPAERGFPAKSLVLVYAFAQDKAVEGLINPQVFGEFYEYARESHTRVSVHFENGQTLTDFGSAGVAPPPALDLSRTGAIQQRDGHILRVDRSAKYPIYTVTAADAALVRNRMMRSAVPSAIAGLLVSALLLTSVMRLARRTRSLESELREAVKYGEIDVHYQPILDLGSGRCIGAEALMRWRHPHCGMIPACEFIAVAENTDLILPMTELLLKKTAASLGALLREDASLHIGINLAPQHFSNTRILDSVASVAGSGLPATRIIFEITERGLVADENSVARSVMAGLAALGAKLAVDDFGTGYSSLGYLQRFPLDYLKIDKAFVDGIESETQSSGLVDQIIRIANSLGMEMIAEGVEHSCQAAYLRAHGVHAAQGWFFGKPMPAHEFQEFARAKNQKNAPASMRLEPSPGGPRS